MSSLSISLSFTLIMSAYSSLYLPYSIWSFFHSMYLNQVEFKHSTSLCSSLSLSFILQRDVDSFRSLNKGPVFKRDFKLKNLKGQHQRFASKQAGQGRTAAISPCLVSNTTSTTTTTFDVQIEAVNFVKNLSKNLLKLSKIHFCPLGCERFAKGGKQNLNPGIARKFRRSFVYKLA